jgi:extradiol dioxygenase family protein
MHSHRFHLSIPAGDVSLSAAWYERVLGCSPGRRSAVAAILDLGGHQLVLQQLQGGPEPEQPGIYPRHFGLVFEALADWQQLQERIVALGEPFAVAPKRRFAGEVLGCREQTQVGDRELREPGGLPSA